MQRHLIALSATFFLNMLCSSPAQACKFMALDDPVQRRAEAVTTVASATAIIDAVVVRPYKSETEPALLKARRVIKGPRGKRFYVVAGATSCHKRFSELGFQTRILLFGGPKVYTANMYRVSDEDIDAVLRARKKR
jgi:hypothetical protein